MKRIQKIASVLSLSLILLVLGCEKTSLSELSEVPISEEDPVEEVADNEPENPTGEDDGNGEENAGDEGDGMEEDQPEEEEEMEMVELVTYIGEVKSILDDACVECHSAGNRTAGVAVDDFASARVVAESGRMLIRMRSTSSPMPPSGNLPDNIIDVIQQWVDDGLTEGSN